MRRLRRILLIATIAVVAVAGTAAAATLAVASQRLGSGNAAVGSCDTDGFTYANVTSGGNVTAVTVTGINLSCAGGRLTVTLANSSNASIGSGSVTLPAAGFTGSASVPMSPQPPVTSVHRYFGIVVGF
jgi:hypothetical protein